MRTKPHRLTFPMQHLGPVQSGSKVATIRFSAVARRVRCGDALALCFGAYHQPTVLEATAVRVEAFDLTATLAAFNDAEQMLGDTPPTDAELADADTTGWTDQDWLEFWLEDGVDPTLLEAWLASGATAEAFPDLTLEAEQRALSSCTAVWFTLAR